MFDLAHINRTKTQKLKKKTTKQKTPLFPLRYYDNIFSAKTINFWGFFSFDSKVTHALTFIKEAQVKVKALAAEVFCALSFYFKAEVPRYTNVSLLAISPRYTIIKIKVFTVKIYNKIANICELSQQHQTHFGTKTVCFFPLHIILLDFHKIENCTHLGIVKSCSLFWFCSLINNKIFSLLYFYIMRKQKSHNSIFPHCFYKIPLKECR